jgi:acetoin utilization deacetylase AcuC-like enzyme
VAISIKLVQKKNLANNVLIVDCDLHQGNGNAYIFRNDPSVFAFSMHQENNYPIKQKGDLDIGLDDGTTDNEYLEYLHKTLPELIEKQKPNLIFYLAGADPYYNDLLGGLSLTKDGLRKRDEFVISKSLERDIPICIVLAGGYAKDTNDVVDIHCNTCYIAKEYSER